MRLIEAAKRVGCWGVKFQLFRANQLYAPEFKANIEAFKKCELPEHFLSNIRDTTHGLSLKFGCTPFDLKAVDILTPYVDYLKIGSYETLWTPLIHKMIDTGLPWMLSAGMLDHDALHTMMNEIYVRSENLPKCVFHCNSNYPARVEDCNLKAMKDLAMIFSNSIEGWPGTGWSDHTVEPGVIHKAIEIGARYIEFHFDLEDGEGFESKIGHCWKPSQIAPVIHDVGIGMAAISSDETNEIEAKKWRTSPCDGLRPMQEFRRELLNEA